MCPILCTSLTAMHLQPNSASGILIEEHITQTHFKVNNQFHETSIILNANLDNEDSRVKKWPITRFEELDDRLIDYLIIPENTTLIIGTGIQQCFLPNLLHAHLTKKCQNFEIMNTLSACRTFNILSADGRPVMGALIL